MPLSQETIEEITAATDAVEIESDAVEETVEQTEGDDDANGSDESDGDGSDEGGSEEEGGELPGSPEVEAGEGEPAGDSGEPEEDQREVPAAPAISDEALTLAVQAGIPLREARSFASEESLMRVVDRIVEITDERKPKEEKPAAEAKADLVFPKLDPEQYDPEVIAVFDAMKAAVQKQNEEIASLREFRESAAVAQQEAAAREVTDWFDSQVASLGDEFKDALGQGKYGELDRGSSQFANREKLASQVAVLLAGYQSVGQHAPPREEVFQSAARLAFADEYRAIHEKKLSEGLTKRSSQHMQRASGRKAKQHMDPMEEAARMLDEKFFS